MSYMYVVTSVKVAVENDFLIACSLEYLICVE